MRIVNIKNNSKGGTMVGLQQARLIGMAPLMGMAACIALTACTTVKLEGGEKPIEINLNVKIDQEVRVRLDKEIEDLISDNPDIF